MPGHRHACLRLLPGLGRATALAVLLTQVPIASAQDGPVAVKASTYGAVALHPQREVGAVVVARNDSRIAAEVAGTVEHWGPDTGARIERGGLLVRIDDVPGKRRKQACRCPGMP